MRRSLGLIARRLSLGVALIVAASAILLFSDRKRDEPDQEVLPRVAVLKYASRPLLDELVEGMTDGLAERNYVDGQSIALKVFDAQSEMPTAAAMAAEMTGGAYDLLLTVSTPCLQAVARANQHRGVKHVFCGVTDPFGAGVGINRDNPLDHPPYLAGVGTFQPVESLFRLIKREFCPALSKVGVVWNPAETCSEACTVKARKTCKELGIELVEASVDKSSDVAEAANALVARGVEAIWLGGDNTVELAVDALAAAAAKGRIPLFCNTPDLVAHGAMIGLGANYHEVGRLAGQMAADVLDGADMSRIRVENVVVERLTLNLTRLKHLQGRWTVSAAMRDRADLVVDEHGPHQKPRAGQRPPSPARQAAAKPLSQQRLYVVRYLDAPHTEEGTRGLRDGLREAGLEEGRHFTADVRSAQGDVATLNNIMSLAKTDRADLIVALCTPTLQAAMQRFSTTPIVYSVVASGVQAGAGRSRTDHRPNVTGIDTEGAYSAMADLFQDHFSAIKRVGTLFAPGEVNSVYNRDLLEAELRKRGVELLSVPVNSPAEVANSALALTTKPIQAVCQIMDNLCTSCFTTILSAAERARMPVFGFTAKQPAQGGVVALSRDYYDAGREAGHVAARVIRGENPAQIPFTVVKKACLGINLRQARKFGVEIPEVLLKRADEVIR